MRQSSAPGAPCLGGKPSTQQRPSLLQRGQPAAGYFSAGDSEEEPGKGRPRGLGCFAGVIEKIDHNHPKPVVPRAFLFDP